MQDKKTNSLEMFGEIVSQALTEAFRECSTFVLKATVASKTSDPLGAEQQPVSFSANLQGSLQGRACFVVKKADIPGLGMQDRSAAQDAETAALLGLLQTTASQLQRLAASRYGIFTMSVEQIAEPAHSDSEILAILVSSEKRDTQVTLYLYLDPQLIIALQGSGGVLFPAAAPAGQPATENLELVMDVELNATLRFGQRQLTLREILDLTSGSVVELDRQVDEPVELVLDGRVIARGEAVIIDGNYGMRITEILQPMHGIVEFR